MVFCPCIVLSLRGRNDPNSTFLHILDTKTFYINTNVFNVNTSKQVCFFLKACFLNGRTGALQKIFKNILYSFKIYCQSIYEYSAKDAFDMSLICVCSYKALQKTSVIHFFEILKKSYQVKLFPTVKVSFSKETFVT